MTKLNDDAWEALFSKNKLLPLIQKKGFTYISAKMMKKYREPRLMAKIDTIDLLPKIFKNNELSILPIKNGEYVVFQDPGFQSFFKFPKNFDLITPTNHQPAKPIADFDSFCNLEYINEAKALDIALMTSLIKNFTGEQEIWLTIRGRQYTSNFQVLIPIMTKPLEISSVQIEIDAGYETQNAIYIFEAKIGRREDFNIRQLLFPYLEWKNRTEKTVVPIFFYYTNDRYYFFQFSLGNSLDASNIVKQACYKLADPEVFNLRQIISQGILDSSLSLGIPFPQANDLNKVIDTVSLVNQGYSTKQELSEIFEFDERQGDYYANAARYLGFLDREGTTFSVSAIGKRLLRLSSPSRRAGLITEQLIRRPVFHQILHQLLQNNLDINSLDSINISQLVEGQTTLGGATPQRRASTVIQWIKWILEYA
jgi:hypothetical protein